MNEKILKLCVERGFLLGKEVLNLFDEFNEEEAKEVLDKIKLICKEKIITKTSFSKNAYKLKEFFNSDGSKRIEKMCFNLGIKLEIVKETTEKIEEKKDPFLRINPINVPIKKITVDDFVQNSRGKYNNAKRILMERKELENLVSIDKLKKQRQASIIAMVIDKRTTKNKNIFLKVEDLTGRMNVLINQNNKEAYEKAKNIIYDDVIGIKGTSNDEIFFANDIFYPEAAIPEKKRFDEEGYIVFISDIHVGSSNFLEDKFLKFIDWINGKEGKEEQIKIAEKIKYIFITGDTVDGVGIYPGQEERLTIKDMKGQYDKLAEYLSKIRKDIKIIISPGQHDAVRVAEPQPQIPPKYAGKLHEMENVYFQSSPGMTEISDGKNILKILNYHGTSMHSLINEIEDLRMIKAHRTPAKAVKQLLKRRSVNPMHSETAYIPDTNDSLFMKDIPDIITTGDLHRSDVDIYNNILIVCSSCWQSITPFEEKVGNSPDPCKVPVFNLKTREVKILDFS